MALPKHHMAVGMFGILIFLTTIAGIRGYRSSSFCPDGYCRHSGKCYLVVGLNATWMESRNYCTLLGGSLVVIKSQADQNTIKGVVSRSETIVYPGDYWLDATDLLNPGEWKWIADNTAMTYTNWSLDEMFNRTENCVEMRKADNYDWTVANCMEKRNFICYKIGNQQNQYYQQRQRPVETDDATDVLCL